MEKSKKMNKVIVDKARLLRRVIIISWITLALCFVVKIFGGNFFEIMCKNQNYKALCEYADTHFWLKYIITILSSLYCECFYLLAILQKYKLTTKQFIATLISVFVSCALKLLLPTIGALFDIWIFFILPYIFIGKEFKKYWWQVPVAYALTFAFQLLSLLVKNLSIGIIDNSTFVSIIFSIDVYIMCVLYYLYRNYIKEKKTMGAFWGIFMGKSVDKLEAMKAKRLAQIDKNNAENDKYQAEVKAIEVEITKRKNEK